MKVGMLGWEFPPFMTGGLGVHCFELARGLAHDGVEVEFYMPRMPTGGRPPSQGMPSGLNVREVEAGSHVDPYGGQGGYGMDFNQAVAHYNERLVASFDPQEVTLLHSHDWLTVPAALELRRRHNLPWVFTVHSTEADRCAGIGPQAWIEDLERTGVHSAQRVIAVSRYTKDILEQRYGADPDKVVAIHNGIDPARFRGGQDRDYASARGAVLFLSRLSRQKGPLFFLKAARRVLGVRPDARFIVAGKGEMLSECIEYTIEHGMADRVRFTGYVPDDELPDLYRRNDIYVLPSVSEPFGISVLEAMAAGLPSIVTTSSGVGEAVEHVLKAPYWDTDEMADMILRLLDSPELREEMGRNGGLEVDRFSWTASCRRTHDAYRSVVSSYDQVMA